MGMKEDEVERRSDIGDFARVFILFLSPPQQLWLASARAAH